ncbi:DoxX family protein [Sphingobacterium daejeonense]|uniref:DoxX family protein n=1 Tax=Sphingobacterium daejeonense TaxID=371142 RepID=A0ABW3RK31_9SPHI|nr:MULTISPECIES: DoxX family protein [Sphingobacterium]MCT1529869.1 DoxX family protein [Sphingobacterium daejeonense]
MMGNIALGLLILRIFIGGRAIYGVIDNVINWEKMQEFAGFLGAHKFPYPIVSAILSVAVQLFCGFFLLVGWQTKWAAMIMFINFLIAIFMVHLPNGDSIEATTPALAMLFISATLFFTGSGKYSIDKD